MEAIEQERRRRAEARLGSWLRGKLRLERVLGAGGMATVYQATHRNGRPVAVKVLHAEVAALTEARRRFINEGYAANRIGHPGVVAVLDDDQDDDGAPFLVMEMLEGESLEHRRESQGGALPPREVLGYADQALDVLAAAHDKGVIHRDIKPENLFITSEGRLKVLDFGLARLQELHGDARLTASNNGIMGTPAYLPPEQARGRWNEIDPRTDLWALGATMFTLASGRVVHEEATLNEMLAAAITRPARPLASVLPGVPSAFAAVVDRALAMAPGDRYPNARAMQEAVRRALPATPEGPVVPVGGLGFRATLASAHTTPDSRPSRAAPRAALLAGAGVFTLVVGGVLSLVLLRSRSSAEAAPPSPLPAVASASPSAVVPAATADVPTVSVVAPEPVVSASAPAVSAERAPAHAPHAPTHPPVVKPAHTAEPAVDVMDRRH